MAFTIHYNDTSQDGFLGDGTNRLHFTNNYAQLKSSIVLNRERICCCIRDPSAFRFSSGAVADFGAMKNLTGCGCIKDGSLERIILTAELDQTAGVSVYAREGSYVAVESIITPASTSFQISGEIFVNLLSSADLDVRGSVKLITRFAEQYVEGEIEGKIDASSLLTSSMEASGKT